MARRQRIEDLTTLAVPEQPALSPDGRHLVYTLRTVDAEGDRSVSSLWRLDLDPDGPRPPRRLTRGDADSSPAWSPDGTRLAFLRGGDGPAQLWLLPFDGGEAEQLTTLPLGAGAPVWSPDGTRIAFSAPVDLHAGPGETDPAEDDEARERRDRAPYTTDRLDYRYDGSGLLRSVRSHLHLVELRDHHCRQLTSGDWHADRPAWSPDGTRLAFSAATSPGADLDYTSPVHVLDVTDPYATPVPVALPEGAAGSCLWTADGADLIVIGRENTSVGIEGLLRVPAAPNDGAAAADGSGGGAVNLAAPLDRSVMPGGPASPGGAPLLADDGRTVLFCVRDRGCSHLVETAVAGGEIPRTLVGGAGNVVAGFTVAGGTAVVVLMTRDSYGELVAVDRASGAQRILTAHGTGPEDIELYHRQEREFTISDGTVVHALLMRDPEVQGAGPLLLDIHGGPHNAWNAAADAMHAYHQELVALGWTVLLVNPRASDGYGERFYTGALGAWGEADAKDLLEPIDQLVAEGVADPRRLAVVGYSYGGFLTCYLTSRDPRFAAAVTGGVISDLTSMVGTADAGHYLSTRELGALPWTDPARYARLSPYARVQDVRTPTLIMHGTADLRCPFGQAQQWHTALRERGVPATLVLYPDASHFFPLSGRPSHRLDFNRRIVDWLERYAGPAAGPARRPRIDAAHWQRRLSALAQRHGVPGAALGILRLRPGRDDEVVELAHGVLSKSTGVETTPDSLFQIGSITKIWTTTLLMQLVDEGKLSLDTPVAEILPELRLADPAAAAQVTTRHLLTHTSGIDGDVFTDTGRGDDCVERYVAALDRAAQIYPPGGTWSYCNSGFVLAGRIVEKLTGTSWDAALRERLITPLGLTRTVTLPEEAIVHRTAVGHAGPGGQEPSPVAHWALPRSIGPAGLITAAAGDVLAFARLHLTGGLAPDGTRLLAEHAAADMTAEHVRLPGRHMTAQSWGLGWMRWSWDGRAVFGHDGGTLGQSAFLRIVPDEGLAITLLTNDESAADLYRDLYEEMLAELAGISMPPAPVPPAQPTELDITPYLGAYEREGLLIEVLDAADGLTLRTTATGPLAELDPEPVADYVLVPVDAQLFLARGKGVRGWSAVNFFRLPDGTECLHASGRATPRRR